MDAGPMLIQSQIDIGLNDDSITLGERLSQDCGILLLKAISLIEQNSYRLIPQDETSASLAPKLSAQVAQINWDQPASRIHDLVRGCLSWSAAFTRYKGKVLKIYKTQPDDPLKSGPKVLPGEIIAVSDQGLVVSTAKGGLIIQEFQLEAKKRVPCREFLCGNKIDPGEILG
jgi:methionyl-tRNA formyltransferase